MSAHLAQGYKRGESAFVAKLTFLSGSSSDASAAAALINPQTSPGAFWPPPWPQTNLSFPLSPRSHFISVLLRSIQLEVEEEEHPFAKTVLKHLQLVRKVVRLEKERIRCRRVIIQGAVRENGYSVMMAQDKSL